MAKAIKGKEAISTVRKVRFQLGIQAKVAIIIFFTTVATGVAVFATVYLSAYQDMINNFIVRSNRVYGYASKAVPVESFSLLNNREDQATDIYRKAQAELNVFRFLANLRYLYTAKRDADGQLIYLIDGLNNNAADIRQVGDPVEPQIQEYLARCLAYGEPQYSDDILVTDWGEIFVSIWPVRDADNRVVGAICMEFDAERWYDAFQNIRNRSLLISTLIFLFFALSGCILFRRVSDSYFKKLAYTDALTGVGNRMAFELDIARLQPALSESSVCLVVFDLNCLKQVNDVYGHAVGDQYIKKVTELISMYFDGLGACYRIGGDEFAAVLINRSEQEINAGLAQLEIGLHNASAEGIPLSVAYGQAWFTMGEDEDLHSVFVRADSAMYSNKRQGKIQDKTKSCQ